LSDLLISYHLPMYCSKSMGSCICFYHTSAKSCCTYFKERANHSCTGVRGGVRRITVFFYVGNWLYFWYAYSLMRVQACLPCDELLWLCDHGPKTS
jgi:hypothetical protein